MGDGIPAILKRQEPASRDRYRRVLELGWRDGRLDVLRRVPSARLNMLLGERGFFREVDFPDCPVSATERQELSDGLPWAVFVMAARVATDPDLSPAAVSDRLDAIADELGLGGEQAREVEREVLGGPLGAALEDEVGKAREGYRKTVVEACAGWKLDRDKIEWLENLRLGLGLSGDQAAEVEREVLGGTVPTVLAELGEVRELAREHGVDLSGVVGTGGLGRVTRRDVELWLLERKTVLDGEEEVVRQINAELGIRAGRVKSWEEEVAEQVDGIFGL